MNKPWNIFNIQGYSPKSIIDRPRNKEYLLNTNDLINNSENNKETGKLNRTAKRTLLSNKPRNCNKIKIKISAFNR